MCAAVPKPKSDTHRKSVSPSVVNRGARNTAEGKPFVPDLARHRKESAMRGRKRRLVRHQRIWRATMKCCASTFAYTLTGPFLGNASRRNPGAGPGVPVPENDTCGPVTPPQHEQRRLAHVGGDEVERVMDRQHPPSVGGAHGVDATPAARTAHMAEACSFTLNSRDT